MNLCFRKIVRAPGEQPPGLNLFWVSHDPSTDAQNRGSAATLNRTEFQRLETLPETVLLHMLTGFLKSNTGLRVAHQRETLVLTPLNSVLYLSSSEMSVEYFRLF